MLMVSEMLTPDEFKLLAEYYLDQDDDSGAASVRITTMLKCRREDTTTGVGAYIKHRLSQTRSVELMAVEPERETLGAKRGTHRVDICRILNKTPYPLELFWIAKDKTEEEMFDEANWRPQKRTTQPDAIHSFQNSYNGHCFGFSSPALGGKVTKHAAIIKLHEATKQWYTVHQALTEDGRSHPDGPLMIEGHSTQPDWTTYSDPSSALPAQQMSPNQVPAPAAAAASPVSGTGSTPVYNIGDAIEVWSVSANDWQKATVDKLLPNNELHVIYGDRYKQINLSDRSAWREANGAESLQRGHSNMGGSVDPTMIEQAVQEAMQMGFEEAAVRTMQVKLRLSSTTALIEALVADSAAI
jgi:hypothetical protein